MASYNGAKYIDQQIRSILQSPLVGEVLVSDDGSSDATRSIVERSGDPRVQLLSGPGRGLIRNFESVLQSARGEYIFLSDQDDIWLPRKVEICLAALRQVDLVVSDCQVVDADLNVIKASYFAARRPSSRLAGNLLANSYLGCCMAFRRKVIEWSLPFPASVPMHDWWIGLVAATFGSVHFLDDVLVQYRRHGGNASVATERSRFSLQRRLTWRTDLIQQLALRKWTRRTRKDGAPQ